MSYSRRQLYAMGEPLGEDATRREVGGKIIYGSGGGGGGNPEKQTTIVDLPDWAKPYAKESLGKAAALSATPYQTYGGERIAQFTPLQKQAFGRAEGQEVASQIGAGSGLAGTAGLMGLTGGYRPGQFGSQMSQYMSPYMDAVVQSQMDSAQRQADIASTQRGAQAVRAGAFGGSRQAIENAEAARALASQKGQIQATGLQSAYDRATDMYGREQALAEQSRQAGLSTALGAAGQLGQLGQQQFGQQMDITGQQAQFGQQQRAATQDILSAQYQDFLNQQRAPYDQLAFMTSMIRGTPMGQTTTQYQPPPSTTSQLIGLGTAAAGAYGAYKGAAGGSVPSYAAGGKLNLEGTFEVADGGGGLGSLGGGGMFNNMGGQGPLDNRPSLAVLPQNNSRPMNMMMRPAVMPQGGNYAAGGIANLKNQPEMAAAVRRMDDQRVAETAGMEGIAGLTAGDEQRRREEVRMAAEGQKAPASMTKITSVLSQMSDAELQQYAKLNKSDPYTMALVVSEANRRKEGGMPTQKAPTVVEQQIAGMALPEEMGIAQLPTGSMEFAGGGIIAFAEGDMVPDPVMVDEERKRAAARLNMGIGAPPAATQTSAAPQAPVGGILGDLTRLGQTQMTAEQEATAREREGIASYKQFLEEKEEKAKTYGTPTEERLKKREEEAKGSAKQNIFMTMVDVGLRVAAGQSPNALSNIAQGAQQGLKGFQERLDTIKTNKEKLDEDYARLYEIRAEKVDAVGERLSTLNREERRFEADAARRAAEIAAAIEGKKIDYKVGKEKSADAFRNATAGSQNTERQVFEALVRKNNGDVIAAKEEYDKKFGKKESNTNASYLKALQDKLAEAISSPLAGEQMGQAKIAALRAEIAQISGGGSSGAGSSGTPLPANPSASNLTVGTVYQTARGPAKWTGTGFAPI